MPEYSEYANLQGQILGKLDILHRDIGELKSDVKTIRFQTDKAERKLDSHVESVSAHGAGATHKALDRIKDFVAISISVVGLGISIYMANLYRSMATQSNVLNLNAIGHSK